MRPEIITVSEMLQTETECANYALNVLYDCYNSISSSEPGKLRYASPNGFSLCQNYPNPFNPVTTINYQLPVSGYVELSIYNLLGKKVTTLVSQKQNAGYHQVEWDAGEYAGGIYLYRLRAGDFMDVKKLVLLK